MEVRLQLGWGIASKPKAQHPEDRNIFTMTWHFRDNFFFDFQAADHQISTRTLKLYVESLKQLFL